METGDSENLTKKNEDGTNQIQQDLTLSKMPSEESNQSIHKISKFLSLAFRDPKILFTLISAFIYIIIYEYYVSFCESLALPYRGLNLPITFFIGDILFILSVLLFIILLIFLALYYLSDQNRIYWIGFTIAIVFIFIYLYVNNQYIWFKVTEIWSSLWLLGRIDPPNFISTIVKYSFFILVYVLSVFIFYFILLAVIYIPIYILKWVQNKLLNLIDIGDKYESISKKIPYMFILVVIVLLSCFFAANYIGKYNAEKAIEGRGNFPEIDLHPRQGLPNGSLILVMYMDNKYFVMEKKESASNNITLYIVRDSAIDRAEIKKELRGFRFEKISIKNAEIQNEAKNSSGYTYEDEGYWWNLQRLPLGLNF